MPVARRGPEQKRLSLEELMALRAALPPVQRYSSKASLRDRFLIPPFSILDARQGYWQERKRMWLALGIQSELGRGQTPDSSMLPSGTDEEGNGGLCDRRVGKRGCEMTSASDRAMEITGGFKPQHGKTFNSGGPGSLQRLLVDKVYPSASSNGDRDGLTRQSALHDGLTVHATCDAYRRNGEETSAAQSGTSIFDPVLCELAYRWFCPPRGCVLDPFAGGSVRGIVAARLGRSYMGIDLRKEQVEANYAQARALCPDADLDWVVGDAQDAWNLARYEYDFLFSCPPYADLERYSDDPRDLSTMCYDRFLEAYQRVITSCCTMLKQDRFACFVVSNVRDRKTGNYRDLVGDTIRAFDDAGPELYNDAVLVTAVGSLPIRVGAQFVGYRKLGRTHQNVLVFLKGSAAKATSACGEVDIDGLEMPPCQVGRVAICTTDAYKFPHGAHVGGDGSEVWCLDHMADVEAYLLCDVIRGEARAAEAPIPRVWVSTSGGWGRLEDDDELTYLVGGKLYLNRELFPDAELPAKRPPEPKRAKGM